MSFEIPKFNRAISGKVLEISNSFPVLLLSGARQVGKTTLLRSLDANRKYVSLDDFSVREVAINEPEMFLRRFPPPVLL